MKPEADSTDGMYEYTVEAEASGGASGSVSGKAEIKSVCHVSLVAEFEKEFAVPLPNILTANLD